MAERGHGSWYFRVELPPAANGRRRQLRRGGFRSQQAARQARDYLRNPAAADPAPATVSTAQWLQLWLDTRLGPEQSTMHAYRQHVRTYLIPYLGATLLRELTNARVQAMFTALIRTQGAAGRPLSAGTLQRIHATLRAALNAAVRRGLIDRNPARYVELPQGRRPHAVVWTPPRIAQWKVTGERPRVAVWTAEQTAAFLHTIRQHPRYPLFHLVVLLGLRRGEVIGLRWSDLDLNTGYLTVSHQARQHGSEVEIGKPKSDASNRVIALDHTTLTMLRRYRDHCRSPRFGEPVGYLFTGGWGEPLRPDSVTHLFRKLNDKSGLPPIRLHDLRHGAASLSLAASNDLKTVQDLLGHASIVLTADTYTSILPNLAHQSAEATAQLILNAARTTGTRLRPRRQPRTAPGRPPRPSPGDGGSPPAPPEMTAWCTATHTRKRTTNEPIRSSRVKNRAPVRPGHQGNPSRAHKINLRKANDHKPTLQPLLSRWIDLVGRPGLEPGTYGLKVHSSTN
ncbi:site-specific integrase [Amycolatopsis taiwanensis]|uniref:Site-specific integrase n=1 Tax=Amycolatopsis taiwanensis TaxID=342230 RepID=A0A9W6R455_9PSEU|nr:site-specific integrase [Amycolatopsis taiwanensis]